MAATYGGFGASSAGVGTRSPGVPAGVVAGSLSLMLECISTSTTRSAAVTGGNGAWVNELFNQNALGTLYCDQKVATAPDAGPTYSVGGNAIQSATAICLRIDGALASDPIFGTPATGAGTTATAAATSINSVPAGACLIWFFRCTAATPSVTTPPSGFTMISAGASAFHVAKLDNFVGGNTGSLTATMSGATNHRTMLVAVNPATVNYPLTIDIVGDGVGSWVLAAAEPRDLVGDGVPTRVLAETTTRDLVGDGVAMREVAAMLERNLLGVGETNRSLAAARSSDLVGDGVISESHNTIYLRSADLVGDGVLDGAKAVTASKTFDLVGDGVLDGSLGKGYNRSFDLVGEGASVDNYINLPMDDLPDCPGDFSPNDELCSISGTVFNHETGLVVSGATVKLYRDSDDLMVASTLSAVDGTYSFPRDSVDPNTYYVVAEYMDGPTLVTGVSATCSPEC